MPLWMQLNVSVLAGFLALCSACKNETVTPADFSSDEDQAATAQIGNNTKGSTSNSGDPNDQGFPDLATSQSQPVTATTPNASNASPASGSDILPPTYKERPAEQSSQMASQQEKPHQENHDSDNSTDVENDPTPEQTDTSDDAAEDASDDTPPIVETNPEPDPNPEATWGGFAVPFVDNLIDKNEDLTSDVQTLFQLGVLKNTHEKLLEIYDDNLANFFDAFPELEISADPSDYLDDFSGEIDYRWEPVHQVPFLPITVLPFDTDQLVFKRFDLDISGDGIPGLQVSSPVLSTYFGESGPDLATDLAYCPDVNARIMGFTYAQIIAPLSDNIEAADRWYYNGFHDWDDHWGDFDSDDQFTRPLKLSNYFHEQNGAYVVSTYPTFSIAFQNAWESEGAVVTFALWREKPASGATIPDFVLQYVFAAKN